MAVVVVVKQRDGDVVRVLDVGGMQRVVVMEEVSQVGSTRQKRTEEDPRLASAAGGRAMLINPRWPPSKSGARFSLSLTPSSAPSLVVSSSLVTLSDRTIGCPYQMLHHGCSLPPLSTAPPQSRPNLHQIYAVAPSSLLPQPQ